MIGTLRNIGSFKVGNTIRVINAKASILGLVGDILEIESRGVKVVFKKEYIEGNNDLESRFRLNTSQVEFEFFLLFGSFDTVGDESRYNLKSLIPIFAPMLTSHIASSLVTANPQDVFLDH